MTLQTWTEILESLGAGTADIYKKTAPYTQLNEPIMSTLCNIWAKYPKSVLLNPYARGFGRAMCSRAGKPVPPIATPPFTGGQCSGTFYDVRVFFTRPGSNGAPTPAVMFVPNRRGKISSVKFVPIPEGSTTYYLQIFYEPLSGTNPYLGIVPGFQGSIPTIDAIQVTPVPPATDNCGNIPPEYPPDPVRDPSDFTKNYTYNIYNQGGNKIEIVNGNLKFDINSDFTFPITVDVGGIEFNIDYDGISQPPPPPRPKPKPSGNGNPYTIDKEPDKTATKKTFADTLVYVYLDITTKPANAKSQWGAGAPDVFYCGWFEFLINNQAVNRQPVHFENNVFIAPENANGYAYTLYVGFQGKATSYIKREIVPPQGLPEILPSP